MGYKSLTKDNVKDFKNFDYNEFKCKCGGKYCNGYPVAFSYELAKNLQKIRDHFGKPLYITSAIRCSQHNINVGGTSNSKHKKGWAVDFYLNGVSYNDLANYVKSLPYYNYSYRINNNQDVIHYDIIPPEEFTIQYPELPKRGYFKKGDRGTNVKLLQNLLSVLNDAPLEIDGVIGPLTISQVKIFQKKNGLVVDGLFGKKCLAKAKEIIK